MDAPGVGYYFPHAGDLPTQTSLVSQERERDCGIAETLGQERPLSSSSGSRHPFPFWGTFLLVNKIMRMS